MTVDDRLAEAVRVAHAVAAAVPLAPSEARAVVRAAHRLPGDPVANLAAACDVMAEDFADRAMVHRHAGRLLREAGAVSIDALEMVSDERRAA